MTDTLIGPEGPIELGGVADPSAPSWSGWVTVSHASILTLNQSPVVLVPSTETLGYAGIPTTLPVPLLGQAILDTRGGAYTNVDVLANLLFAFGSDWSDDASIGNVIKAKLEAARLSLIWLIPKFDVLVEVSPGTTTFMDNVLLDDNFEDNALALALDNGALGNLTGGNVANSLKVRWYGNSITLP